MNDIQQVETQIQISEAAERVLIEKAREEGKQEATGNRKLLGITNPYALEQKVSIDKKTIFSSEEEFNKYFEDYKKQINNLRAFEKIEISYSVLEQQDEINYVKINVQLKDSIHILAVPYLKYDSNTGLTFKLKAKDTNFLGSLNSMSTDLNFAIENNEELGTKKTKIGFNFNYDYPFSLGLFNSTWVNDFEFSTGIQTNSFPYTSISAL